MVTAEIYEEAAGQLLCTLAQPVQQVSIKRRPSGLNTFSERLQVVSLLSASYVRSVDWYQWPHSRR